MADSALARGALHRKNMQAWFEANDKTPRPDPVLLIGVGQPMVVKCSRLPAFVSISAQRGDPPGAIPAGNWLQLAARAFCNRRMSPLQGYQFTRRHMEAYARSGAHWEMSRRKDWGLKTAQSAHPAFKKGRHGERPKPLTAFLIDPFYRELAALHQ